MACYGDNFTFFLLTGSLVVYLYHYTNEGSLKSFRAVQSWLGPSAFSISLFHSGIHPSLSNVQSKRDLAHSNTPESYKFQRIEI
jgi:hypothetical protein